MSEEIKDDVELDITDCGGDCGEDCDCGDDCDCDEDEDFFV